MTSPRSVRFDGEVLRRLDGYVRSHPGTSVSAVTNLFVDEALRDKGHDVIAVAVSAELAGSDDATVLDVATGDRPSARSRRQPLAHLSRLRVIRDGSAERCA
ncbi:MAG: hypothetical protein ACRDQ4_10705 [Pseudonocardiaceae bacterium]